MWASYEPCSLLHCVDPKVWTTASSSTSKPLREKKLAVTSCCESPTRSWRTWECPGSATRSSYWKLWTYSVLWWVLGPHPAFPSQSFPDIDPPPKSYVDGFNSNLSPFGDQKIVKTAQQGTVLYFASVFRHHHSTGLSFANKLCRQILKLSLVLTWIKGSDFCS